MVNVRYRACRQANPPYLAAGGAVVDPTDINAIAIYSNRNVAIADCIIGERCQRTVLK
jgi:hypothetical protein